MEYTVPVNEMLKDDITKLNYTMIPPGYRGDVHNMRMMQQALGKLINQIGEQSAVAQGLPKVITTAEKLQNSPTYTLYLLKDAKAKGGAGEVIGLLKVGRKHLYLFDHVGKVSEVEPLCVLDFFVSPSRQRRGCGRALFEHMLREEGAQPRQLAIDGPSIKMERFLAKNYGIERLLRQSNNFAVAPEFFNIVQDIRKHAATAVPPAAVGRFAAHKPQSSIANVIHGGNGGELFLDNRTRGSHAAMPATPEAALATPQLLSPSPRAPAYSAPNPTPSPPPRSPSQRRLFQSPQQATPPARPSSLGVQPAQPPVAAPTAAAAAPADAAAAAPADAAAAAAAPADAAAAPADAAAAAAPADAAAARPRDRRDSQLTGRGYFDIKFYHNKLW